MENLQTLKTLSISSVLCLVVGIMMPVLLNQMPTIAIISKWVLVPIGLILMAYALTLLITQGKGFKFKKSEPIPPKSYGERMADAEQRLYEERINTQIQTEKMRQSELLNRLEMEKAKIEQEKAKAQHMKPKYNNNIIGNVDEFIRMPRNSDPINRLKNYTTMDRDNDGLDKIHDFTKQRKQKKHNNKQIPHDDFFKW